MKRLKAFYKKYKTKLRIKVLVSYTIFVFLIGFLNGGKIVFAEDTEPALKVSLSAIQGIVYTKNNIPLKITFENGGLETLRILGHFDPLPVFFTFKMVRADGTPISIPGGGKISFFQDSIKYIELNKDEKFDFQVDLAGIVSFAEELKEGNYTISLVYHNQYGESCFKGSIRSNSINVEIKNPL